MILYQRDHTFIIETVGVEEVSFVYQNHRLMRSIRDEFPQLILRRNAGGGIIRIADVNQSLLRHSQHFGKIMSKGGGQRDFHHLGTIDAGIIKNCFKSGVSRDKLSAFFPSECLSAEFENLT